MAAAWDPQQYLKYEEERQRPFEELLSRVSHPDPRSIVDLGCGPGTTTASLVSRFPRARIVGIDNSEEMISHASQQSIPGQLEFREGDLRDWEPDSPVDIVLSCAALHWVDGHVALFGRFINSLAPGGVFAFQVPGNFDQPSHVLLNELASSERWSARLKHLVRPSPVLEPQAYLSALLATGTDADVWETTYLHILKGPDAVLEWVRGTALRPFVTALSESGDQDDVDAFTKSYAGALRAAYPRDADGRSIFPFRRIFAVARVPDVTGAGIA